MIKAGESTRRRGISLTIRADIIETAKLLGLNASQAAESGIVAAIKDAQESAWRAANEAGIAAHNTRLAVNGPVLTPHWARKD